MDVEKVRKSFPLLNKKIDGKPPIYLDSACVTLMPQQVMDAMNDYYINMGSCGARSVHRLGVDVTRKCEEVREKIRRFLNAEDRNEIIFAKNSTEAINLVANSLTFENNDTVITTDREHNSNQVVWQNFRRSGNIKHHQTRSKKDDTFDLEGFKELCTRNVKLVSVYHTSNLDGHTLPIKDITEIAHENGALVMLDAAQSAGHKEIDVKMLDVDLLCFSFHKMLGPSLGVLYGRSDVLESLSPFIVGGGTVTKVENEAIEFEKPPRKFEGGLQNYAGIIGGGAAIDYIENLGRQKISVYENALRGYVSKRLGDIHGISSIGVNKDGQGGGIYNFNIEGMNPHDVALYLDSSANIMVRSGMHCLHSWYNKKKIDGSVRASFYLYNTMDEAKIFAEKIEELLKVMC
ncbi:MAG: aminotransferase class V-fold PLP-dependent enzyme [Candidatus Thermoplasmatota archaeon]|jgi:cysteine desulfurase/selenocysteine lyase|nr:aminotransferase class V-fold PLP-dependent enzyme [Candidatus Thermoplasmatota archaeon]